jgi:predicted AlkP superfamily pyrophosphatase or phosphodiesterase
MTPTLVVDAVGLSQELLGRDTPHLNRFAERGVVRPLETITPAVTCSAQATFLTGRLPREHGIVGNGWYFRELAEVWFWRQSNRLIESKQVWELGRSRDPAFTSANLFWWYNMYCAADWSITPRPMYPADGRKLPDVYSEPGELRTELQKELGQFPLFRFWGPAADITSSRWITSAALRVMQRHSPTLTLVYLPHLDYDLQRLGPDIEHPRLRQALRDLDALCGELIRFAEQSGRRVIVLSEYGITKVTSAVHINRELRREGWVAVREELGRELLDAGASRAFAVADHQVAHVYVKRPELVAEVGSKLRALDGVESVLDRAGQAALGLDHARAGELVAIAKPDRWFSYYYWLDPAKAPDFATTVDIHKKPGYDPVELFLDPKLSLPKLAIGWRLLKKGLGFRTLMDVISPDDDRLVKGSHGRVTDDDKAGPVFISSEPGLVAGSGAVKGTDVAELMLGHVFR